MNSSIAKMISTSRVGKLESDGQTWTWQIDRSDIKQNCKELGDKIESPTIKIETEDGQELQWLLRLYPEGMPESNSYTASLQLVSMNASKVCVKFRLIIARGSEIVHKYKSGLNGELFPRWGWERGERYLQKSLFTQGKKNRSNSGNISMSCHFDDFSLAGKFDDVKEKEEVRDDECESMQDDILIELMRDKTFGCVEIGAGDKTCGSSGRVKKTNKVRDSESRGESASTQSDILWKLVKDETFGDVLIKVNGNEFRAHRVLLSTQSKIFDEMLSKKRNRQTKSISIDDIDDRVFIEILRCIYFGKVYDIDKYAKALLEVAVKYSMEKLKKMCVETVCKNLTSENAIRHLRMADLYGLEDLRSQVIAFMASNFDEMKKSSSYISMKIVKKESLVELMEAMAMKLPENTCN